MGHGSTDGSGPREAADAERAEWAEWLDAFDDQVRRLGPEAAARLLSRLQERAATYGLTLPYALTTPYVNSIPRSRQPRYPGSRDLERRIKSIIRWNAMAMVVRANRDAEGIGGHISTYASAATLYEVGFNHFFRGPADPGGADQVFFQGHASPGIYARAFLEGRLDEGQLTNFRRELAVGGGLPSYPHPRLMPGFWQFATVSMGLGPILAIYQARFNRYLEDRGLVGKTGRVWAFVGDGEMDEPEALGAISLAARERLDNLVMVVNCNLQRLDGPVRGNQKIIQELEAVFRGAGWHVIKVIWGDAWDALLERDVDGVLVDRMGSAVDGDYQMYSASPGAVIREHFFGGDPRLAALVEHLSDEELRLLPRGGHDPEKVFAAYQDAVSFKGAPSVVLAKTIKGYGLGEAGEGKNVTHQQKKLNEQELREFRARFAIPVSDADTGLAAFYRPPDDSPEARYLRQRRQALGGSLPARRQGHTPLPVAEPALFEPFLRGSDDRPLATTMAVVRLLGRLLKDPGVGARIVPIIPDEARTFGMDALFRQIGIYSHIGQRYTPVDRETLLYYKEDRRGQILEEGITEAGAMASFIAAGTSDATHRVPLIPFFFFYSMFGFQRVGDLIWAAGDMRARGFLVGATAGRTTLAGEGLQHQDGHSHLLALAHPHVRAYDPATAGEVAVLVRDGLHRMFVLGEETLTYLTVANELYPMPALPEGAEEGILRGLHRVRAADARPDRPRVHVLGSGAILNEALRAADLLVERYGVAADVWSATSYPELYRDARAWARRRRLQGNGADSDAAEVGRPWVARCLDDGADAVVAASDYVQALPAMLAAFVPQPMVTLGTDGFGRSESREALRAHFEVSAEHICLGALSALVERGRIGAEVARRARDELGLDPARPDPAEP